MTAIECYEKWRGVPVKMKFTVLGNSEASDLIIDCWDAVKHEATKTPIICPTFQVKCKDGKIGEQS